jgi:hypothetical protein
MPLTAVATIIVGASWEIGQLRAVSTLTVRGISTESSVPRLATERSALADHKGEKQKDNHIITVGFFSTYMWIEDVGPHNETQTKVNTKYGWQ